MSLSESNVRERLFLVRSTYFIIRHWLILFIVLFGIYTLLPFVAPVAMQMGWRSLGNTIYDLYATQCHQMAQRSFFFFGAQPMYNPEELPLTLTGNTLQDMLALRAFRGNEIFGWKVAWSDRMVFMYGSLWIMSLVYWTLSRRRTWKPFPLWTIVLFVPLALDGVTHLLSDGSGLFAGFRYDNVWLAALTNYTLPNSFYRGDALGSFNSLMRFITGLLFALTTVGLAFPFLDQEMKRNEAALAVKLHRYKQKIIAVQQ